MRPEYLLLALAILTGLVGVFAPRLPWAARWAMLAVALGSPALVAAWRREPIDLPGIGVAIAAAGLVIGAIAGARRIAAYLERLARTPPPAR